MIFCSLSRHKEPKDPDPQLIAEAIAAFQTNNYRRTLNFSVRILLLTK
jgi:hypothetical protein